MPQTTHTTHPIYKNLVLTFTEEDHKCVYSNGLVCESVTTLIGQQFAAAAARVADRERTLI